MHVPFRIDPEAVVALDPKHSGLELPQSLPVLEHIPRMGGTGKTLGWDHELPQAV